MPLKPRFYAYAARKFKASIQVACQQKPLRLFVLTRGKSSKTFLRVFISVILHALAILRHFSDNFSATESECRQCSSKESIMFVVGG